METTRAAGMRTRPRAKVLAAPASSTTRSSNKAAGGRSSKKRKAATAVSADLGASYLKLRSWSVFLSSPVTRSTASSGVPRCSSSEIGRISRCSSSASLDVAPSPTTGGRELAEELDTATCSDSNRGERMKTRYETNNTKSTVELPARRSTSSTTTAMPSEAEIEEFFAAAEKDERQRFADKYNYDVINDVPLVAGHYEWVPFAR